MSDEIRHQYKKEVTRLIEKGYFYSTSDLDIIVNVHAKFRMALKQFGPIMLRLSHWSSYGTVECKIEDTNEITNNQF